MSDNSDIIEKDKKLVKSKLTDHRKLLSKKVNEKTCAKKKASKIHLKNKNKHRKLDSDVEE